MENQFKKLEGKILKEVVLVEEKIIFVFEIDKENNEYQVEINCKSNENGLFGAILAIPR